MSRSRLLFALVVGVVLLHSSNGIATVRAVASCSQKDIVIVQGQTKPLPNGIPNYLVTITNTCNNGCAISNIHLHCGQFSSAILVNPKIFKRVAIDDCLVNGGKPLAAGLSLSFNYATTFQYPLSVSSFTCH